MSQYRDDRGAARLRIEALEARLAEREAELLRHDAELAARDDEIERLQRELELSGGLGPRRMRSVNAAWASRIVGAASTLAILAAGAGVLVLRGSAQQPSAPPVVEAAPRPIHADPVVVGRMDWSTESEPVAAAAREPSSRALAIRRRFEPRVWGGRAPEDETRLRRSICLDSTDNACRERARDELERARDGDP